MRLVAVIRGDPPAFSMTATLGIVLVFLIMGCALALLFALVAAGRGARPAWWSLVGVALIAWIVLLTPLRSELAGRPVFIALFVPVGLLLGWTAAWLTLVISRYLPEPAGAGHWAYGLLALPALLATIVVPALMAFGVLQLTGVIPIPNQ